MNINAGSTNGGFPNIFGKGFLAVQSNSMSVMENPIHGKKIHQSNMIVLGWIICLRIIMQISIT